MAIKKAEVGEAETQIKSSQRTWARLKELYNKGAVSIEDFSQAQSELDLRKAQLETRRAQLQEVEVRYQQATRRLERLTQRQKEEGSKERRKGGDGEAQPGAPLPRGAGLPGAGGAGIGGGPGGGVGAAGGPTLRPGGPGGRGAGLPGGPGEAGAGGAMGAGGPPGALAGPAGGEPGRGAPGMMGRGLGGHMRAMGGGGQGGMMGDMMGRMGMGGGQAIMDARGVLAPGPRLLEGGAIDHSWASDLFEERSWDFGSVRRGERLTHSFRLTNDLNQMVEIKDVRVSAGFLTARANGKQLAPGASATINVQMDTTRFSGNKTSSIYVQFALPWQATVQLLVQADSRDNTMGMMGGMSMPGDGKAQKDSQAKIAELERKVDILMEEMHLLRDELAKQGANKPSKEIRK